MTILKDLQPLNLSVKLEVCKTKLCPRLGYSYRGGVRATSDLGWIQRGCLNHRCLVAKKKKTYSITVRIQRKVNGCF
jgi:hypothetical protein